MIRWNPGADELTLRVFRALYRDYDLRALGGSYVAVPKGTPCYTAPTLGEIARQISDRHPAGPAPEPSPRPGQDPRPPSAPGPPPW